MCGPGSRFLCVQQLHRNVLSLLASFLQLQREGERKGGKRERGRGERERGKEREGGMRERGRGGEREREREEW